jgi:hypothetical protein
VDHVIDFGRAAAVYRECAADRRRGLIKMLVYVAKCAPPMQVGINPMEDWTAADLDEWAEEASELNKQIYPDD